MCQPNASGDLGRPKSVGHTKQIVAAVATVLTIAAAWVGAVGGLPILKEWLVPFGPTFTYGRLVLIRAPGGKLAPILPVEITNSSSQGCIRDVAMILDTEGQKSWVFFPTHVLDYAEFLKLIEKNKDPFVEGTRGHFVGLFVGAKARIQSVLMQPWLLEFVISTGSIGASFPPGARVNVPTERIWRPRSP